MDISKAKKFVCINYDDESIYISKDVNRLLTMADDIGSNVLSIIDTEAGEQLFEVDIAYSGEPIILRRFMHIDSFMKFYKSYNKKEI